MKISTRQQIRENEVIARNEVLALLPQEASIITNVLYIDDDPPNLVSFRAMFRRDNDINVFTANTLEEAIHVMESQKIDVVCSDYRMPRYNGAEVLRIILSKFPNIKTMIVTAYADSKMISKIRALVKTPIVISKPYSKELFLTNMHKLQFAL